MGSDQSRSSGNRSNDNRSDNARNQSRQSPSRIETPIIIYERIRTPYSYAQADLRNEEARRRLVNEALYPNLTNMGGIVTEHSAYTGTRTTQNGSEYVFVDGENWRGSKSTPQTPSAPPAPQEPTPTPQPRPTPLNQTTPQPRPTPLNQTTPQTGPAPLKQTTPQPRPAPLNSLPPQPRPAPLNQTTPQPRPAPTTQQGPVFRGVGPASSNRGVSPAPLSGRSASSDRRNWNDKYKCPTCEGCYGMYIYQCPSGHSSCEECRRRGTPCALCGLNITDTRNFTLEEFLTQMKIPCPNASDGCRLHLRSIDIDTHLVECPFGVMDCPTKNAFGRCLWRGKPNQMVEHFGIFHPAESNGDVNTEFIIPNITSDSHNLHLVELSPYCFVFHEKVDAAKCVYMTVQLLGTAISASKWNYEVHVYNKREPRRKYTYMGLCSGSKTPVNEIFNRSDCAVLPLKYAKTFANNATLTYKFFIKKQDNVNPKGNFAGRGRRPRYNNANK